MKRQQFMKNVYLLIYRKTVQGMPNTKVLSTYKLQFVRLNNLLSLVPDHGFSSHFESIQPCQGQFSVTFAIDTKYQEDGVFSPALNITLASLFSLPVCSKLLCYS